MNKPFALLGAVLLTATTVCAQITQPGGGTYYPEPTGAAGYPTASGTLYPYPAAGSLPASQRNIVRTYAPQLPTTDSAGFSVSIPPSASVAQTTYLDGFARPVQRIARQAGVAQRDLIQHYDNRAALTTLQLLPYPAASSGSMQYQATAPADQQAFYSGLYPNEDGAAYTQVTAVPPVSGTPAVLKTCLPGRAHVGQQAGSTLSTRYNTSSDPTIRMLELQSGLPVLGAAYPASQLRVRISTTADAGKVLEFYEKDGKLVCKAAVNSPVGSTETYDFTYYLYNDLDQLGLVAPPKASAQLLDPLFSWQPTPLRALVNGLCFTYTYDASGRIFARHVPGQSGVETTIYDVKGRPVLVQTPLQRDAGDWSFSVYDGLGRVVLGGIANFPDSRTVIQGWLDGTAPPAGGIASGSLLDLLAGGFTGTYPTAQSNVDVRLYNYYDRYSDLPTPASGVTFTTAYSTDYLTSAYATAPVPGGSTQGLLVGRRVKVLANGSLSTSNEWNTSVYFYDALGRLIQTHTLNPWNTTAWDVATTQYNFNDAVVRQIATYNGGPASSKSVTKVVEWFTYDYENGNGRLLTTSLRLDGQPLAALSSLQYDALGRVQKKTLGGIETQAYQYGIRGDLKAINRDYTETGANPFQDVTFGCTLHTDYGFPESRLDGQLAGLVWRGAGGAGNKKRAYGYTYDRLGRLTDAPFMQYDPQPVNPNNPQYVPAWSPKHLDYSVSGITYDANGNLRTLRQRGMGVPPGGSSVIPVTMDDLTYTYPGNGNALRSVDDGIGTDYHLHDFTDNGVHEADEYGYDADGNLTLDRNKGIDSIRYQHQDLPLALYKGTAAIRYLYDATGALLAKTVAPDNGPAETYRYLGPLVFRNDDLQFVLHSEGRARWMPATSTYEYDYFVRDHLGNVRTVVTPRESPTPKDYLASLEVAASGTENLVFGLLDDVRELRPGSVSPQDTRAARLSSAEAGRSVGTALVLRVMAGDRFDVRALSYHDGKVDPDERLQSTNDLLATLVGALTGGGTAGGGEGGEATQIVNELFSEQAMVNVEGLRQQASDPSRPQAYLNYLVFDETMRLVQEVSGMEQAGSVSNQWAVVEQNGIPISSNGYLVVYVSNQQPGAVYFDNVGVRHYRGALLEEMHYYPLGLTIRSPALNPVPNRYWYQGKELEEGLDVELYDFHARRYDPQLGRFWGVDPLDQFPSPYTGMGNDYVNGTDPTGMAYGGASLGLNPYVNGNGANQNSGNFGLGGDGTGWSGYDALKGNQDVENEKVRSYIKSKIAQGKAIAVSISNSYVYYLFSNTGEANYYNNDGYRANAAVTGFQADILQSLDKLGKTNTGTQLLRTATNLDKPVFIEPSSENNITTRSGIIKINTAVEIGGFDEQGSRYIAPFISLGHEMIHSIRVLTNTMYPGGDDLFNDGNPNTFFEHEEKVASHVENILRSENNMPLRAYYMTDYSGGGIARPLTGSELLKGNTRNSLYFSSDGNFYPAGVPLNVKPYRY